MSRKEARHNIEVGAQKISYSLFCSDRKRLRIVVSPDLTVQVFAPKNASIDKIEEAIRKKSRWIARMLEKVEAYQPLPVPKQYVSGETLVYLGRQYRLKVEEKGTRGAKLMGRFLWVCLEDKTARASVKKAVDAWYRERARETLSSYVEKCSAVMSRHGVSEPVFALRAMRTRWGSCSRAGRITLNVKLVQVPVHCIEYVIMHELCHLKHHNHSKTFYSLLTRCQPDWRERKEALDRFRLS